jgi:hypothetical protein
MRGLRDLDDAILGHAMAAGVILDESAYGNVDHEKTLGLYVGLTEPSEGYTGAGGGGAPLDVLGVLSVPSGV